MTTEPQKLQDIDTFFNPLETGLSQQAVNTRSLSDSRSQEPGFELTLPPRYPTAITPPTMAGWATNIKSEFPPSPPGSTVTSPKQWQFDPQNTLPPHLFTNDRPPFTPFADFGQITPPDDECDSILDTELQQQRNQEQGRGTVQSPSLARTSIEAKSASKNEHKAPTKRTRRYTTRKPKEASLDPNDPEDVRRSKFLERNRVAASKCRQKKKEWTHKLESRARDLQKENTNLRLCVDSLNEEVFYLKNQMTEHKTCDCHAMQDFMRDPVHQSNVHDNIFARSFPSTKSIDSVSNARSQGFSPDGSESSTGVGELANDERALEALLTSSITQDTSDESIARKLEG